MVKLDNRSDPDFVLMKQDGKVFARRAKKSHGRFFRQSIFNRDTGFEGYKVYYLKGGNWRLYDDRASKGEFLGMAERLAAAAGG